MPAMSAPARSIPVALLGATGAVGQRFAALLAAHPWFRLAEVVASPQRAGQSFGDAISEPGAWLLDDHADPRAAVSAAAGLQLLAPDAPLTSRLVFSALDAHVAGPLESRLAALGHFVVTNAKSHRLDGDVPLVVPEVNGDAIESVRRQKSSLARGGAIVANPNCTTAGLVLALAPLHAAFGVDAVHVVTLQALSGAGRAGLAHPRMSADVVPFIDGEEEKIDVESKKILAHQSLRIAATCTRVPVVDGHTLVVSVKLARRADHAAVVRAFESFVAAPQHLDLPSAPSRPIHVHTDERSPRPALHRDLDRGMATHIGRLRPCPLFDWRFVALTHNTIRGAAGGSILLAELAVSRGLVGGQR
jgi:aspartate-semialdehyde dehydrogenase